MWEPGLLADLGMMARLTLRQREAVDHRGSNLLVEAVPGSGKTRVIVARCAALLAEDVPASAILVLTFSRRAVAEIRARLSFATGDRAMPEIRTFHGFAARLLGEAGESGHSRRLLSEPAERALFERVVASTALPSLPEGVAGSPLFRTTAAARVAELRRAPADALARLAERASPRLADLIALDASQKRLRDRIGVADYDDLVARAATLASRSGSAVADALRGRYRHVLVDEFQDTDPLQFALLECLGAELFAVGDAAQAIYGFRGAARDAMHAAETRLAMHRLALDESFRCPEPICKLARSVWSQDISLRSRSETTGDIAFRRAASPHDEAAFLGDAIAAAIAQGVREKEIAVLVRSAEPMARLVETELRARGISVARTGGENVLDDLAVDAICAALAALANPTDATSWVRLLGHPALGIEPLALRLALLRDAPRDVDHACALLEALPTASRDLAFRLATALRATRTHWDAGEPVRAARAFAVGADLLGFALTSDEDRTRRTAGRITTYLDALADVRDVHEKLGLDVSSRAIVAAFTSASDAWRASGENLDGDTGVRILTVHAAKGLEFEFVAIADAVDGHFPQTWRADSLVSASDIATARACGVDLGTRSDEHDAEERSLWYVAVTRAKRTLLVTWSQTHSDGSPLRPSRFIALDDRTREQARASYRGLLGFVPEPLLEDRQTPTAARLMRPVRTSAMETWLSCRRKFYYDALLRIGSDERGFAAKLGTLVHRAVHEFHAGVRDFRNVDLGAHVAWAATLRDRARAIVASETFDAFDSPLELDAALRSADRLLDRYARSLENTARADDGAFEVVATEERVDYEVAGIAFSGSIDRIDRRSDGSLVLNDVKTGKLKDKGAMLVAFPKLADAVENDELWVKGALPGNPQLPLYRHAKPATSALAYLYLGSQTKFGAFTDAAHDDRLDVVAHAGALAAIDGVLTDTFVVPWTTDGVSTLEPTRNARICMFCEFVTVCPGYLEDDE